MRQFFADLSHRVSTKTGSPYAFLVALGVVVFWVVLGPVLGYSQQWQLFINTGTTIVTFLMVFLIQSAENHDQAALHLKLDELLRSLTDARTGFVNLENLSEAEIEALRSHFDQLGGEHRDQVDAAVGEANDRSAD